MYAKWTLVLLGLAILPLSASAQVAAEPVASPAEPKIEVRTNAAAAEPLSVTTEFVGQAGAPTAAPPAGLPAAAPGAGLPGAPATAVTPSVAAEPGSQNDTERRLDRLEKMMESILAEMKNQRPKAYNAVPSAANAYTVEEKLYPRNPVASRKATARVTAPTLAPTLVFNAVGTAPSLSELKKQRIDIEDELENVKKKLAEIDDQIAKLQASGKSSSDKASTTTEDQPANKR